MNKINNIAIQNILAGESVFRETNLPNSEYMAAVSCIKDGLDQIKDHFWQHGSFIHNLVERLEENRIFDYPGHDEALAELSRLLPFSFEAINRLVLHPSQRKQLFGQMIDSYVNQVFDIDHSKEYAFNVFVGNLISVGHDDDAAKILELLTYRADSRFDTLRASCFASSLLAVIDGNSKKPYLVQWIIDHTDYILSTLWGKKSLAKITIDNGIELFQYGLTGIGTEIMRLKASSAASDELIVREKLTGMVPTNAELCAGKQIPSIPLMSYILWTKNPDFDPNLIKDRSFKGTMLNEALTLARRHSGGCSDETKNERIKIIARNVTPQAGLTDVLDRFFFSRRSEHEVFIREVLMQNLVEHQDEILSISIIAKMMARHKIELDTSPFVHHLDKALIDELSTQRNMTKYLCQFSGAFISLFGESTVIECLDQAAAKASKSDINTAMGVIPTEIVMKCNGLKRHRLIADLSL